MAHSDFLDALLKPRLNGDGPTGLFYKPIKATDDLITASRFRGRGGERLSELHIAPPSVKLGSLPTKILDDLNRQLVLSRAPSADEVVRVELDALLAAYGGGDPAARNVLQVALEQKELTGALNAAARKMNQSTLSPVERAMLSRPNIAMYAFFRAAIGMNIKDVDGIITNVLSSLGKVLTYVNRKLVAEVLERHNLQAEPDEIRALQDRLAGRYLSYEGNDATRAVLEEYEHVKGNAELIEAVNTFLGSGLVAVPPDVNRDRLVKQMIAFLSENGFDTRSILGLDAAFGTNINGLRVQFEDQSVDDGRITSRLWDFGDGNASNMQNPTHQYASDGSYEVSLTVGDDDGNTESVSRTITVAKSQEKPMLEIEYATSGLTVQLGARYSNGAAIKKYSWDFGDGTKSKEERPKHEYAGAATYKVVLDVEDENGGKASAKQAIQVIEPPERPQADFRADENGLTVSFEDRSKGRVTRRRWEFGDGATSNQTNPQHTYSRYGRYKVRLTVTGDYGHSDTREKNIDVAQPDGSCVVYGTVVRQDGKPASGLLIRAYVGNTQVGSDVTTDDEGKFDVQYPGDAAKKTARSKMSVKIYDQKGKNVLETVSCGKPRPEVDIGTKQIKTKAAV